MAKAVFSGFVPEQAYFPFLETDIVQHITGLKTDRDVKAKHRQTYTPKIIGNRPGDDLQIPLDLLDRPIASCEDLAQLPKSLRDLHEDLGDVYSGADDVCGTSPHEKEAWSDKAIMDLFEGVLHHSLALLGGRSNAKEKAETLQWFFAPDVIWNDKYLPDGSVQHKPVRAECIPFTFQFCCAIVGMRHERIREGLLTILHKAGLGEYVPSESSYE